MIILFLLCEIVLFIMVGYICFANGYRDGLIDGRLEEKWRKRDERKDTKAKGNK